MNSAFLDIIPQWYKQENAHDLVLSDDIDSLASCALLGMEKDDWKIKYFYNFTHCYSVTGLNKQENDRVWVDVAILQPEKAFDNHVSRINEKYEINENIINPNLMAEINNNRYNYKYAGSTLLLLWSLYEMPLPRTEEGKMLLLCIDSAFKGHYNPKFAKTQNYYLSYLFQLDELKDVIDRHTESEFYELIEKYKLNSKIEMDEKGYIHTDLPLDEIGNMLGLDLCLPLDKFEQWKEYQIVHKNVYGFYNYPYRSETFTMAFTYKDTIRFSVEKRKGEILLC